MSYVIASIILILATVVAAAPAASERTVGDLRVEMTVGRTTYSIGEPVLVSARAVNTTAAPVTVTTASGFTYDMMVRQRGALVWQWSHDKAATQAVRTQQPGSGGRLDVQRALGSARSPGAPGRGRLVRDFVSVLGTASADDLSHRRRAGAHYDFPLTSERGRARLHPRGRGRMTQGIMHEEFGGVAQLVRARGSYPRSREFESPRRHHIQSGDPHRVAGLSFPLR